MDKLKVVLDWFPNTNHTGYLLAQKRGWFREAGLDVEISGDIHGAMHLGDADFVCGPEISMLDCMERGEEMTCVAVMTQKCDSGIVSLKEAGITRPRELEGKRLTHWSPEWFHKAIGRVVAEDGGDYSKVKLLNMDVGDIVATLGTVADATWVYENWENQVLLEAGREINYFNLGDVDPIFDFCAPAIGATRQVVTQRPQAVRAFLAAADRAYIEVAKDPKRPFFVKTSEMQVRALGTRFNVTAYRDDLSQMVVLVEGLVEVQSNDETKKKILQPDHMLTLAGNSMDIKVANTYDFISWKDGLLQFRSQPLSMILAKISRHYDLYIDCEQDIKDLKCSGKLVLFDDPKDVLETIARTISLEKPDSKTVPMAYEMNGNTILLKKKS